MIFFLDTEFNGWHGELISLALVPQCDDDYFYEELIFREPPKPWIKENVLPHLDGSAVGRAIAAYRMSCYFKNYDKALIVADWPDDFRYFLDLMVYGPGACYHYPPVTMKLADKTSLVPLLDNIPSDIPHHALHDAIALKKNWIGEGNLLNARHGSNKKSPVLGGLL